MARAKTIMVFTATCELRHRPLIPPQNLPSLTPHLIEDAGEEPEFAREQPQPDGDDYAAPGPASG